MRTPYDLTHGLAQWRRTQGPGNLRSQFIRNKQKGTERKYELSFLPLL